MLLIGEMLFIVLLVMVLFLLYKADWFRSGNVLPRARVEEYWTGKERREHVRFKKVLEVSYSTRKTPRADNNSKTIDISAGGMKLLLAEKLQKGAILDLKVALPDGGKTAKVEGEVVWSEEALFYKDGSGRRFFYSGIRFRSIKEPAGTSFFEYVRSLASDNDA